MSNKEKRTEFVNKILILNNELSALIDSKEKADGINLIIDFFNLQKSYMTGEIDNKLVEVRFKNVINNFINGIKLDLSNPFVQLAQLYKERDALGMFNHHRILAECKNCKLYEDETTEGYLVTYKDNDFINATNLKFLETDEEGIVICPLCKNKIDVSLPDLEEE